MGDIQSSHFVRELMTQYTSFVSASVQCGTY
jgi:hypothetical protein